MLFWAHIGLAGSFGGLLAGGCGAWAVSRKTPIYFICIIMKQNVTIIIIDHQALHFTVLAEKKDTLRACLALFPVVAGIFFIFLWVGRDAEEDNVLAQRNELTKGDTILSTSLMTLTLTIPRFLSTSLR